MSAELTLRVEVDKELSDLLKRSTDKAGIVKRLKRAVPKHSMPTLNAIKRETPFLKGQLLKSMGITNKTNPKSGEVYSIVGLKDNIILNVGGVKTLYSGAKKIKNAASIAARHGASAVSSATAFKYIRKIETGFSAKGKVGRKAGGAFMIQKGYQASKDRFPEQVGNEMLAYVLENQEP